jgi:hypothetical protein
MNNPVSTPEGITLDTCKPVFKIRFTLVIVAIQFQVVNIAASIVVVVVVIQFILGVTAKDEVRIDGNLELGDIQFGNGSHG